MPANCGFTNSVYLPYIGIAEKANTETFPINGEVPLNSPFASPDGTSPGGANNIVSPTFEIKTDRYRGKA